MKSTPRPRDSLGDLADEIGYEMHEHYPLLRACWFGISILRWQREDAEMCIRAEFETISAHEQIALLATRRKRRDR